MLAPKNSATNSFCSVSLFLARLLLPAALLGAQLTTVATFTSYSEAKSPQLEAPRSNHLLFAPSHRIVPVTWFEPSNALPEGLLNCFATSSSLSQIPLRIPVYEVDSCGSVPLAQFIAIVLNSCCLPCKVSCYKRSSICA